jgi:hypothetical protein
MTTQDRQDEMGALALLEQMHRLGAWVEGR